MAQTPQYPHNSAPSDAVMVQVTDPGNTSGGTQPLGTTEYSTIADLRAAIGGGSSGGQLKRETTGTAGFALANSTGNVLSWTAPSDGNLHAVTVYGEVVAAAAGTGGQLTYSYTAPGGSTRGGILQGGNAAAGVTNFSPVTFLAGPGGTVTVTQSSPLTAGTVTAYAEIWSS